jgi:hypothetical protein
LPEKCGENRVVKEPFAAWRRLCGRTIRNLPQTTDGGLYDQIGRMFRVGILVKY